MVVRAPIRVSSATVGYGSAAVSVAALLGLQPIISRALAGMPDSVRVMLSPSACGIAGALFLLAGGFRLVGARLAGRGEESPAAGVLIFFGIATPLFALAGPLVHSNNVLVAAAPGPRVLICLSAMVVLARYAFRRRRAHVLTGRLVTQLVLGWFAAIGVLVGMRRLPGGAVLDTIRFWQFAECLLALGWLALALRVLRANRLSRVECRWVAVALSAFATCSLLRAYSLAEGSTALNEALSLQVVAAAIFTLLNLAHLRLKLREHREAAVSLAQAFAEAESKLSRHAAREQERIHDARSAVAGIAGAARLLAHPGPPGSMDSARISALMNAEIRRLEQTLAGLDDEPVTEFSLAEVIEPVIAAHQLSAAQVSADLVGVRVLGRAQSTATVVANLLANIRAHAPDAATEVRVERLASGMTALTVSDDGPGIPVTERGDVLIRGRRGSRAGAGTGLGLHTAATTMSKQGGTLVIGEGESGGTKVTLTLPTTGRMSPRPA